MQKSAATAYDPHALAGAPPEQRVAAYARLQQDGPVFVPAIDAWVLTRYADVRRVLTDLEHFTAAGSIGISGFESVDPQVRAVFDEGFDRFPGIIEMDPPDHTVYRALVDAVFKPRRVASMEPRFREIADGLIDGFIADGRTELVDSFTIPFTLAVICHVIGVPDEDIPEVHRMSAGFAALEAGTIWSRPVEEQVASAREFVAFQHYAADLVAARRSQPREDLITELVTARLPGGRSIPVEEAISWIIHLLFAGHETNARSLASTVHLMLDERELWERIVVDESLIPGTVEEGLRMEPPVTYHTRTAVTDVEIGGAHVPRGSVVHLVFAAANYDADLFEAPTTFDPSRPNRSRHLGFGGGIHHCVGAPVARLESRVALEQLARRLPTLRLQSLQPAREVHVMLRGLLQLPVEWL